MGTKTHVTHVPNAAGHGMGPAGAGVLERLGGLTGLTDLDLSRNYFAAPVLNPRP